MPTFRDVPRADEHDQPVTEDPTLDRYLVISTRRRHDRTRAERNRDTPRVVTPIDAIDAIVNALDNNGLELWEMNDFA